MDSLTTFYFAICEFERLAGDLDNLSLANFFRYTSGLTTAESSAVGLNCAAVLHNQLLFHGSVHLERATCEYSSVLYWRNNRNVYSDFLWLRSGTRCGLVRSSVGIVASRRRLGCCDHVGCLLHRFYQWSPHQPGHHNRHVLLEQLSPRSRHALYRRAIARSVFSCCDFVLYVQLKTCRC